MTDNLRYTGGCQCGAIRYRITGELLDPDICHCRMCQKAFGSFFAPLIGVTPGSLEWTRGKPALYQSSTIAERGFCSNCGTPLTYQPIGRDHISVSIGSLDEPARAKPAEQVSIESRMPWFSELADLPGSRTEDDMPADILAQLHSNQHPDHD
jgi:hypothetical protein